MKKIKLNKNKLQLLSIIIFIGFSYFLFSQEITKTLKNEISKDDYKQSLLNIQKELNSNLGIAFNNIDIESDQLRKINQDFGLIAIAELSNNYLYGYEKHKDIYNSIKVTPIDGDVWYFYDLKDEYLNKEYINEENLLLRNDTLKELKKGPCLIYIIGRINGDTFETNQKNVALSLGLKLILNNNQLNEILK